MFFENHHFPKKILSHTIKERKLNEKLSKNDS